MFSVVNNPSEKVFEALQLYLIFGWAVMFLVKYSFDV